MNKIQTRGEVFTKLEVVQFMLNQIGYRSDCDLRKLTVLEPAAGDGAFVCEIIKRLKQSSEKFNFDFKKALNNISAVEIDEDNFIALTNNLDKCGSVNEKCSQYIQLIKGDFLIVNFNQKFDIIVGNPPYVRWDNIAKNKRSEYKIKYKTFKGRCDLYVPFYEKALGLLSQEGVLSYICSNRWFKSSYGLALRKLVSTYYHLNTIVDLEEANPFKTKVTAYSAITNIDRKVKECGNSTFNYIELKSISKLKSNLEYKTIVNNYLTRPVWQFTNKDFEKLDSGFYSLISDQGFSINIGIATGKDSVFIGEHLPELVEDEVLVPLIKANDLKNNELKPRLYVIDCFTKANKLIDLDKHPKLKKYLTENKAELTKRHIAQKQPGNWFRTIDKIKKENIHKKKILLPDITGSNKIHLDGAGFYPHHNIYYIVHTDSKLLHVLAGVLSSSFIRNQLLSIGNKMNGGYPRWQSQNIKRLVIPCINKMSASWKNRMLKAFLQEELPKIDSLMQEEVIKDNYKPKGQMNLFT